MGTLTEAEKVDIRRHCGYQAFGNSPTQAFGWRFATHYGSLEFRMNNLQAEEEAVVRSYLTRLNQFENDEADMSSGLDTAVAAVFTRNPREMDERKRLYSTWVKKLLAMFGVPSGPGAGDCHSVRLVV